jgi:hypothetical protein
MRYRYWLRTQIAERKLQLSGGWQPSANAPTEWLSAPRRSA